MWSASLADCQSLHVCDCNHSAVGSDSGLFGWDEAVNGIGDDVLGGDEILAFVNISEERDPTTDSSTDMESALYDRHGFRWDCAHSLHPY